MVAQFPPSPLGPEAPLGEILLAETAIKIELPSSLHRLAVERYDAVRRYIERTGSPLEEKVALFYPQGSMAIRATIKARKREDGYDIDIIAELLLPAYSAPAKVLDLLFEAVNGLPGSQYFGKVVRQTRCVTVLYEDGMHLDITPSLLFDESDPRKSHIFHAKAEEPASAHKRLLMNTYAFIEWFNQRTPIDLPFTEAYAMRALAHDRMIMKAAAPAEPVPDHSTKEGGKSSVVVALQLLKRNRNLRYAKRDGRMPPSVMMACFAGHVAAPGNSISGALEAIVQHMMHELGKAQAAGVLVNVRNPKCLEECFTDRWPENLTAQQIYLGDLKAFSKQLSLLMNEDLPLPKKRNLLIDMFGEGPGTAVIDEYSEKLARGIREGSRLIAPSGRVVVGATVAAATIVKPAPAHTFFGTSWPKK
ncbi:nucleotidyltransferase [Magnetospirillum fulvum]|uniref:Nucleotidyltransferase n=1 Tax=Magnetospirillum fulvum MGU-K5 TaxID=1316936 RepID=S9S8G6_MAGFU|nr:nucleotidyltransferase [Magnetospirillum fulvum]EPY00969.1 hypothetical protein K678_13348 [Magnetospirillum fulvum MGU-K5]